MSTRQVIKRDGSLEPFSPLKIQRVVLAAGLENDQAIELTNRLSIWIESQPPTPISTLAIRDQVQKELASIDPHVANFFSWYQKSKNVSIVE